MTVSLLSISLSFVSHHRTLRLSLPDKQNLNVMDCNLIVSFIINDIKHRKETKKFTRFPLFLNKQS